LALLVAAGVALVGLSGCGAPGYTYVTDSANSTYYKVPAGWHPISQSTMIQALDPSGAPTVAGLWVRAFDAGNSPQAGNYDSFIPTEPFVFSEVVPLSRTLSNGLSYDGLRDFNLPVTLNARQQYAMTGQAPLTGFTQTRDDTITSKDGVHGVRETFQYTLNGLSDTWDEVILTNAAQTVVYLLITHCTSTCFSSNEKDIDTVMQSFTVGSSS
jgi:hypothetical protein